MPQHNVCALCIVQIVQPFSRTIPKRTLKLFVEHILLLLAETQASRKPHSFYPRRVFWWKRMQKLICESWIDSWTSLQSKLRLVIKAWCHIHEMNVHTHVERIRVKLFYLQLGIACIHATSSSVLDTRPAVQAFWTRCMHKIETPTLWTHNFIFWTILVRWIYMSFN